MIHAKWLGRIGVKETEDTLDYLHQGRAVDTTPDLLLILEHEPPAFAYHNWKKDRAAIRDHVWFDYYCAGYGVELVEASRGGGMMYHGPGQIVLAPVLKLKKGFGIPEYARALEETMIRTLRELFGLEGFRVRYDRAKGLWVTEHEKEVRLFNGQERSGMQGVWVMNQGELRKIGFIGSHFDTGVVSRGCALNLAPDLDAFSLIDPCDLPGVNVTSVERLRGFRPKIDVKLAQTLAEIFGEVLLDAGFSDDMFLPFEDLTKE